MINQSTTNRRGSEGRNLSHAALESAAERSNLETEETRQASWGLVKDITAAMHSSGKSRRFIKDLRHYLSLTSKA